ncbi:hypothetical protein BT63DRAFT_459714 [Microthyrium microscopicum]|uniref:Uncharacterized protein n=1 Tax=Microthyrium microscopicum TaxID=703497 RepID=A0A6A6U2C1_9PEZI|nr:hypothetical protein BT63DRAFT_459714 [Microthyrium microscopicum]
MVQGKRADVSSQLDVERMIVDYLSCEATQAIFQDYGSQCGSKLGAFDEGDKTELAMQNVEAFTAIFKQNFPQEKLEGKGSFRVKLLQLTILLSQRVAPGLIDMEDGLNCLESLKTSHSRRRSHFVQGKAASPLGRTFLAQLPVGVEFRAHHIETLRENGATEIDPPLLRLLSLFCKLSMYRGALDNSSPSLVRDWMNLAGQLMLQSCLELILVHGVTDAERLREAFSWSWKTDGCSDESSSQLRREVSEWEHIRAGWAGVLSPPSKSIPLAHHLLQVASTYSLATFERDFMTFLENLHDSGSAPHLSQLDSSHVQGLSGAQLRQLLRSRA